MDGYSENHIIKTEIMIIVLVLSFHIDGSMTEDRNEFEIIADILRVAILGSNESEIIAKCSLERELLEKYMPTLLVLEMVSVERKSENFYRPTNKGLEFLRFYHGLRWLLWGKNSDFLLVNILTGPKKDTKSYYIS
ncbi:MAG: hypothetical protein JSW53_02215 [Candidatus Bathyarchaeota archaeon]|nr:MAG: hypothetical protein JSW53_02215 [Candidatus Bathyarchaeota archaeon]